MIHELKGQSYEQSLLKVNLTTLEIRHLRADLIEMFKILKGFDKIRLPIVTNNLSNLRGHSIELFKQRFVTNIGKYVFVHRIIEEWNKLSLDVINTVNSFKNKLDRYLRDCHGLTEVYGFLPPWSLSRLKINVYFMFLFFFVGFSH